MVKRIYREYLEGASLIQIGCGLEADGILTGAGKTKWRPEALRKILQNEKYIGDALLQKTYTVDFLYKKRVQNDGIVPQYYVKNSHEPIIHRDPLYAGAGGDDPAGESPQRSQPEKESLQQQVCLIQHCLLTEVRGDLSADRMEQPVQTLHSLEMLHPCGAWTNCL